MLSRIRFGVISAGRMAGYTMLDIMRDHPIATPVAWYEIDPSREETADRERRLAERGVERCGSLESLLSRDDVDVILNTTPHYAHAETSIAALRAGHPVLCEKPPACCLQQLDAMAAAAAQTHLPLLIHFQHILRPSARWLSGQIRSGALGRIRRVACRTLWFRETDYYRRNDWSGKRYFQGKPTLDGTMTNQTIHYLHQMLALANRGPEGQTAAPADIHAALYRFHPADALEMEDTVVARGVLDNEDRTEFFFAGTTCAAGSEGGSRLAEYQGRARQHEVVIEGERGTAVWNGGAELQIDGQPPQAFTAPDGPWPFYFHLQAVLAHQEPPVTPVTHTINTMRFIFGAYAAAKDRIRQVDWERCTEVAPVLDACTDARCLPGELAQAPDWA